MIETWKLMLSSRKVWTAIVTALAIIGAVTLCALGKIPPEALTPTIIAMAGTGSALIASIAWEDVNKSNVQVAEATKPANAPSQNVTVNQQPQSSNFPAQPSNDT